MREKTPEVKPLLSGAMIVDDGKDGNTRLTLSRPGQVRPDHLVRTLRMPDVKAVALTLGERPELRTEFTRVAATLLEIHPAQSKFSVRLKGFPDTAVHRALREGLAEWMPGREPPMLPYLAEDIARTWQLLARDTFAIDSSTRCTFNFETAAGDHAKPWHKDSKHRPADSVLAVRWFGDKPVIGLALTGIFTKAGVQGKALLHDVEECLIPDQADFCAFKPEEVIHGILPVQQGTRWSYTITGTLRPRGV